MEKKVEAYLRESKHRAAILQRAPRNGSTPLTQEVIGMFIEYDASKGLHNQAITPEQIVLDFKPAHVKKYKELTATVLAHFATMQGSEQVKQFVQLCAIEIKFLYGCSMSWDGSDQSVSASPSPALEASAGIIPTRGRAGAISDDLIFFGHENSLFGHNRFSIFFFSLKVAESEKIVLANCILDFKDIQV